MSPPSRRLPRVAPSLAAALAVAGVAAAAQVEERGELGGRVLLGDSAVGGATIVLHRVAEDSAGELDSVRSAADGSFRFALPSLPAEGPGGTIYFASVRHQGILYFGPPVTRPIQLDSLYEVRAYDTVPAPAGGADLPIGVRYLIFEPAETGWQVTDLFEIAVGPEGTLVPRGSDATWSHALPVGARQVELGGMTPGGPEVRDGRLEVRAPLSPGLRQFVVRYLVDDLDGLAIPFEQDTEEVELLVREPVPALEVSGLGAVEAVEMEPGVAYRRHAGAVPAGGVVVIARGVEPASLPMEWLAVILALLLAAAALWAMGRGRSAPAAVGAGAAGSPPPSAADWPSAARDLPGGPPAGAGPPDADERDRLLLEIARIDERLEGGEPGPEERERLSAERRRLLDRLRSGG